MAYFDWSDEELFDEAIETLDPLKITIRSRPVIVVGPIEVGCMSMDDFAQAVRQKDERFCAIDPGRDLEAKCAEIEREIDGAALHFVLGMARLDIADRATYDAMMVAFEDRRHRFTGYMPHIELDTRDDHQHRGKVGRAEGDASLSCPASSRPQ
jgi:hypothetical protein